jgi:hypothetical protein
VISFLYNKFKKEGGKYMENQPNWQPIQNLPIIANLIDGQSSDAKEQYGVTISKKRKLYV